MGFDRLMHRAVVAVHEGASGLGVEAFVEGRRSDEIREDDGDDLALPRRLRRARD
ncbi:MAG TPA: hypothetical protein VKE73_06735 [Myxococcota bacterium]|nr:hypothetical protein [Myxococcota bacterium]